MAKTPKSALQNSGEIIFVSHSADQVKCDGGGGALGHPLVWYKFDMNKTQTECGYCDRVFVKQD